MDTRTDDTASADTRSNALDAVNAAEQRANRAHADWISADDAAAAAIAARDNASLAAERAYAHLVRARRALHTA